MADVYGGTASWLLQPRLGMDREKDITMWWRDVKLDGVVGMAGVYGGTASWLLQPRLGLDREKDITIWCRDMKLGSGVVQKVGPGRKMARGRIGLSFHSPHNLYPIGQLSSAPILERNPLGMLDSCVEKITPAEAVQALLSHETQEAAVAE
ncbi:uncharacterized protein TRIVIDRAFT_60304 [Trichoderma virens Gv29-8]|uniref:Uncharacterized protein n=1 Tax=Hypocrea virens (strain Gv29-8 / FGSC 10586) TaxID=413071 RepID=G9MS08_HYPVG|nr:uncharacterized protein TRIVIDRAFT_60304 [Trichoderma virens Gv29-8]EHK22876.1 hypothetical protein TRIVIDRAFT_60304 [Trichoderma virens Gv29-8]UKZ47928.1 hypothetical protein TrVGV298_002163 [Trichoderma virens]